MPWTYAFDPLTDTVFVTASGILSDRELVPGVASLMRDPNFHPGVRVFDDYSQGERTRTRERNQNQSRIREVENRKKIEVRKIKYYDL